MKYCSSCGNKVSATAKFCGECGTQLISDNLKDTLDSIDNELSEVDNFIGEVENKPKNIKKKKKGILNNPIVIIILVILGAYIYSEFTSSNATLSTPGVDVYKTTIEHVMSEYDNNEVKAEERFKDNYIQVIGYVGEVRETLGSYYLDVSDHENSYFSDLSCKYSSTKKDELLKFNKNDKIMVTGRVGNYILGRLNLRDCKVSKMK